MAKKARGNTRVILKKVNRIQDILGDLKVQVYNDRNPDKTEVLSSLIEEGWRLALDILSQYDPID